MRHRRIEIPFTRVKTGETYMPAYPNLPGTPQYFDWSPVATSLRDCSDETSPGPPYKWVNPFSQLTVAHPGYNLYQEDTTEQLSGSSWYRGRFWVSLGISTPTLYGDASSINQMDLDALGATGWNKFKPVKPVADIGVMLGESYHDIPDVARNAVRRLRSFAKHRLKSVRNMSDIANQHLAWQFGWLPLIRDLQKCYTAFEKMSEWLSRVRKDNGRWVHRGGTVLTGSGSFKSGESSITPPPTFVCYPPEGISKGTVYCSWGYRVWFSAWFKYYVADLDTPFSDARLKARLFGLHNTPLILWNLLPWSWLVDWFSNLGDNISNLIPIDGLVAKMPCIMRHCWTRYDVQVFQRYKRTTGELKSHSAFNYKYIETKARGAASPFGFGLSDTDLSLRQLSILAALGVSRSGL